MSELTQRIAEAAAPPAQDLLAAFYDPSNGFAATTFDDLPDNPTDSVTAADLLAVSLLDVPYPPSAVRNLLQENGAHLGPALTAVRADLDLWAATDDDLESMQALWNKLGGLTGVGATRKSKLLARKRPRLFPIVDSVVRRSLPLGTNSWITLREALRDEALRQSIEALRPFGVGPKVPTLRLLDALVWIRYSEGKSARRVRQHAGLPLAALPPRRR